MSLTEGVYEPLLTAILTPREYRNTKYMEQKHLHPNDIEGSGHMYLFKIASILASDVTVDKVSAYHIMYYINDLWDVPMKDADIDKLLEPMFNGKQKNPNGEPYWFEYGKIVHKIAEEYVSNKSKKKRRICR